MLTNRSSFRLELENTVLWFIKGNHRARLKHNMSGKLKSSVARILKLRPKILNVKLKKNVFPQKK